MTGKITPTIYLASHGWIRDDAPAEVVGECGMAGDVSGWCMRSARWSKGGSRGLCAQHAMVAQRYEEATRRV